MQEFKCEACGMWPAMDGDIICRECATRYAAMLETARSRTTNVQRSLNTLTEQRVLNVPAQEVGQTQTLVIEKGCRDLQEIKCEACRKRPAMDGDIICRECATRYAAMLETARSRTTNVQRSLNTLTEQRVLNVPAQEVRQGESTAEMLKTQPLVDLEPYATVGKPRHVNQLVGYLLLSIGLVALIASVMLTSTILSFVGLGLAFWGLLAFFIQPQKHVKSFLMDTTALSSLKTIDRMMMATGYREKGVYVPTEKEKVVVFVPLVPHVRIPTEINAIEDRTFIDDPLGMVVVPPGLALANLIEKNLGFTLRNCGVETILQALPKVLDEDLEIVRDVEIEVRGNKIDFRLVDSIYYDFCRKIRNTSKRCGLGCPMCSALACILAGASGKPVLLNEDELNTEKGTTLSSYEILNRPRL